MRAAWRKATAHSACLNLGENAGASPRGRLNSGSPRAWLSLQPSTLSFRKWILYGTASFLRHRYGSRSRRPLEHCDELCKLMSTPAFPAPPKPCHSQFPPETRVLPVPPWAGSGAVETLITTILQVGKRRHGKSLARGHLVPLGG